MNGIRFYLEYPSTYAKQKATRKRLGNHCGTVIAVLYVNGYTTTGCLDAIGGVYALKNSPVASTAVNPAYLGSRCKRVSERIAHSIHPQLLNSLAIESG